MDIFIGTSGWSYSWNPKRDLGWYIENTPFNAIEVNSSFYHFPREKTILRWVKYGNKLRFVIKVHRSITHLYKFNEDAKENWIRFYNLFKTLEPFIELYLFQIPPSMSSENISKLIDFHRFTQLGDKFAFEPRRADWFYESILEKMKENNITFVSVSAPKLPDKIIVTTKKAYIRFHGKDRWYSYKYNEDELREYVERIKKLNADKVYIFFNNDYMLENGIVMYKLLSS
ncbi:DUF72 domain-containing protein [Dictyoglomus sp.]|jgi:uncharacterized protein YecE (DUF72 family)|uniref:DUF72 domain-containing protein n=1 Tax=Dictyoglomus sp. TaxID=28205 RepID=UPI003D136EEB